MTTERQDMALRPSANKLAAASTAAASVLSPVTRRQVVIRRDCVASEKLLSGGGYLLIRHNGYCYQLRQTAAGKLILTKEPGFEAHVACAMQD
jgi:hemin uptake protein HemP